MNAQIDDIMNFGPNDCPRCGMNKNYHTMKIDGKIYIPCIRKRPYKLADGVDVRLGMQVWNFNPRRDDDCEIITGMVRFISRWGDLSLWKYPEDRVPEMFVFEGRTMEMIGKLSHEHHLMAKTCYSSLENAKKAVEKCKEKEAALEKWRVDHKW